MENLGMIIRKSREELTLKAYELAKEVGINPVYITQIEKHGKLPSPSVMKRISEVLCNERLFDMYLKRKYPMFYGKTNKRGIDIDSEFKKISEAFKKKNMSLAEVRKLKRRMENLKVKIDAFMEELRKIMKSLGKIEKRTNECTF